MFTRSIISQPVHLHISDFGFGGERDLIAQKIEEANGGVCIHEGYVRPKSTQVITYSAGECNGAFIQYMVQFECDICTLYEGMVLQDCIASSVYASAGISGDIYLPTELTDGARVPFIKVYLLRDTHLDMLEKLEEINEHNNLTVEVIGVRFQVKSRFMETTCRLIGRKESGQ